MSDKRIIIHDLLSYYNFNSEDLMNIIISHKIDYSTNSNGIFVNFLETLRIYTEINFISFTPIEHQKIVFFMIVLSEVE